MGSFRGRQDEHKVVGLVDISNIRTTRGDFFFMGTMPLDRLYYTAVALLVISTFDE